MPAALTHQTGGFQSGQMGWTVNPLAYVFEGSNPSPPTKRVFPQGKRAIIDILAGESH